MKAGWLSVWKQNINNAKKYIWNSLAAAIRKNKRNAGGNSETVVHPCFNTQIQQYLGCKYSDTGHVKRRATGSPSLESSQYIRNNGHQIEGSRANENFLLKGTNGSIVKSGGLVD